MKWVSSEWDHTSERLPKLEGHGGDVGVAEERKQGERRARKNWRS